MTIAVSEEHDELRRSVRRWLESHCGPDVLHALRDAEGETLQPVWHGLAAQGWLGIHVAEEFGGQGFGLFELAVVLEQCGAYLTPGPLLSTAVVSAAVVEAGTDDQRAALLPSLTDGTAPAGLALGGGSLETVSPGTTAHRDGRGLVVGGRVQAVLGAQTCGWALVPVATGDAGTTWCLVDIGPDPAEPSEVLRAEPVASLDPTRRLGVISAATPVLVPSDRQLPGLTSERLAELTSALAGAEVTGVARWCLETASEYAKVRRQFGRPIGQFQAVKHRLADMLVHTEQMAALSWDAALAVSGAEPAETALAVATAGGFVFDAGVGCAKDCIQLLGGIGFTWEHDAHLYLKRALATRQLTGDSDLAYEQAFARARAGVRRSLTTALPGESETVRAVVRPLVDQLRGRDDQGQRAAMVDLGLVSPHWPPPFGRGAGPLEQLVIEEELAAAGLRAPHLGVGAWALPVIIAHGTDHQRDRWVKPTLRGELTWCQLFSEPGAGSDLASLSTRAERTDGGWLLNGQKVWTSMAHLSQWGICLARSDPTVPKHEGITYCIVDMTTPGIDVRPLREITGDAMFNEVFLDGVFVPDDCVIGAPGDGWSMARATLGSERVSISSGATFGVGIESLLRLVEKTEDSHGEVTGAMRRRLGALVAEAQSLRLLGHRATLRALAGADAGAAPSVRKLLGAEHEQRVQELGLQLFGPDGAALDGRAGRWAHGFLVTRCLTIAGGTSEIQRNVIAERILGQPRDPEPVG